MSATPQAVYNFPDLVSGTTLKSRQFSVTVNDNPPTNPLSAVSIKFAKDGATTLTLSNGSGVTITDAANWEFTVGPVAAGSTGLAAGIHKYDCKLTDSAGVVTKWIHGVMRVLETET